MRVWSIDEVYEMYLKKTKNPVAAAILVMAGEIQALSDDLDHNICMGMRNGIFGNGSSEHSSVLDLDLGFPNE